MKEDNGGGDITQNTLQLNDLHCNDAIKDEINNMKLSNKHPFKYLNPFTSTEKEACP